MSPLYSLYKDLTVGVNVLRVIAQFHKERLTPIWLKRLSKQNSPLGSLATVVAAALAFV